MQTLAFTLVFVLCVVMAAVIGYLFAIVKNRPAQITKPESAPVARPVAPVAPVAPVVPPVSRPVPESSPVDSAPVTPKTTPKTSRSEKPAPVAPVNTPKRPKNTPVKADVEAVLSTIPNSTISDTLRKEAANFKLIFSIDDVKTAKISWTMPDYNHILMEATDDKGRIWSQKEDIKNGGRRVALTENESITIFKSVGALLQYLRGEITLEEASRGKATKKAAPAAPVANEPAPVAPVVNEPAPVTPKKAPKNTGRKNSTKKTESPKQEAPVNEPVNDTPKNEPAPETKPEPKNEPAPVKKNDILAAIKEKIGEGCTLSKSIACTIGKKAAEITSVSVENDTLFFVADEKARKATDVYFSTKTCAEILANVQAPKQAPKNDVQPISDEVRYAQNTAEAIIKTCNNKNVKEVTFTDSIATTFTQPKSGKTMKAEIVGLRRDSKGNIMVCGVREDKKTFAFELSKGASVFNLGTLRTIGSQINEGLSGKKAANARIEKIASVA